jgi:hypothetical protein
MEHYRDLLHLRFAARVMGWREIEPSRETGALKFYGLIDTGKGPQRREVPDYSNDLDAMWAAEQYLHRLGLTSAYINALAKVTRASTCPTMTICSNSSVPRPRRDVRPGCKPTTRAKRIFN